MEIHLSAANGYCFLNSVIACLQNDYDQKITFDDCVTKIVSHLCQNYKQYVDFHPVTTREIPPADKLLSDALDFFRTGRFNQDVVDLLMQITVDALHLNMFIYQKAGDNIQVLNFKEPDSDKIVRVKFTHCNQNAVGNHYDAIICKRHFAWNGLQMLTEVATSSLQKKEELLEKDKSSHTKKLPVDYNISVITESTPNPVDDNISVKTEPIHMTSISDSDSDVQIIDYEKPRTSPNYSGTTEVYSMSDETYISSTDSSRNSSYVNNFDFLPPPPPQQFTSSSENTSGISATTCSSSEDMTFSNDEPHMATSDTNSRSSSPFDIDEFEMKNLLTNISRGKPFPTWFFDGFSPLNVDHIPDDIDGTALYKIKVKDNDWHRVTRDKRHFVMHTTSREGFTGIRRIGTCLGSFVCRNEQCPFILTSPERIPNKVSWRVPRGKRHIRICTICDHIGVREGCGAKKLVEFDSLRMIATVYHLGEHTCWAKLDNTHRNKLLRKKIGERQLSGPAKQVGISEISRLIDLGDMDAAAEEAENWVDRRAAERQLQAVTPTAGHDHNSFDAVGIIKRKTDQRDPYYIFRIGNRNLDGGCDYVFKSARKMAQIAIMMDQDGETNILQMENAYFDTTHTRVYGFKTFGLWLIHPAMKQILRLASMELRSENYVEIANFFVMFNNMLSQEKGEIGYKFNPRYFVCDEGGANYKALRHIYGEEFVRTRVKGCQWHFKSDVKNHLSKIGPDQRDKFKDLCHCLCQATTITQYKDFFGQLRFIARTYPEVNAFLKYWDLRKSHVFPPFRGGGLPGVNLSEQGNASFKPPQTMRLVHAAKYDVSSMILQESQINLFEKNMMKCAGRGPSKEVRDSRDRAEQVRVAEDFANIFDNEEDVVMEGREGMNPSTYLPKKGTHRAPTSKIPRAQKKTQPRKKIPKATQWDDKDMKKNLMRAMEILDCDLVPDPPVNAIKNPPLLVEGTWQIRKCRGCKREITAGDKAYPRNMVLRRSGIVGYLNKVLNKWVQSEQNVHFHMNMACVRKHDATMEVRYITCNDEFFIGLDQKQMEYLAGIGFLKPIARKKSESLGKQHTQKGRGRRGKAEE